MNENFTLSSAHYQWGTRKLFALAVLCLSMIFGLSLISYAQQVTVTGRVTSAIDGEPLPGVNIQVKGTSLGTVTDINGNYSIAADAEAVLIFSFIGFTREEVAINSRSVIDMALAEDITTIDEVVVIGYGTQQEKDLTSAITTLKGDEITKTPAPQAMQALQGKVAGVQIVSRGEPGEGPTVRVRGIGTFEGITTQGDAGPLFVVDGMFFDDIDFLNPSDIATLSVLKDASASAIYGVRAANGVVLIETKSGSYNQEPEIVYDGYYGVQVPQNVIQMANAEQFVRYVNETGSSADMEFIDAAMQRYGRSRVNPNVPNVNTDWYDEIMEPAAAIQNHSLTFNGGSDKTRFSIGANYFNQQGLLKDHRNEYERLNFRIKIDTDVNERLTVGGNFNASLARRFQGDNAAWFRAYFAVPTLPAFDETNVDASPFQLGNAQLLGYRNNQNPFFSLLYNDDRRDIGKLLGNFYLEVDLIPDKLSFRTAYNYNVEAINRRDVNFAFNDGNSFDPSSIRRENVTGFDQVWDNFLTYEDNFGPHNLTIVAGQSYRSEYAEMLFAEGQEISPELDRDAEEFWYLSNALNINPITVGDVTPGFNADGGVINDILGRRTINGRLFFQSFFGRVAYNYDDRYLFYSTIRADGNNKFQETWGTFATVGAGWVLSEESFFDVDFINFLKFRGSWGQMGNDAIRPAVGAATLDELDAAINDVLVTGRRVQPTFDFIGQWETTEEINLGITARFLENRLSMEADYFVRDSKDVAVNFVLPLFRDQERRSVGEIRNTGFELALNWSDQISNDLTYTIGGNMATLKNEVRSLGGATGLNAGQEEFRQRSIIGEPFQAFFGYEVAGVFQNQDQIDNSGYTQEFIEENNLVPGDFFFRDQNGDGIINDVDRVVIGSFLPDFNYGFNVGISYKNIDFTANFQGQVGHQILNRKRGEIIFTNDTNLDAELVNNLWRGEGTSNRYPSASGLRRGWNQAMSEYFVESGSFFRIQNVRLSYTLNDKTLFGVDMPDTRVTLTAERPLTVFDYNGFNPEVPNGVDRQTYPIPAIYTLGLNVKL